MNKWIIPEIYRYVLCKNHMRKPTMVVSLHCWYASHFLPRFEIIWLHLLLFITSASISLFNKLWLAPYMENHKSGPDTECILIQTQNTNTIVFLRNRQWYFHFFFQGCLKMLCANEILVICNKLGTWILELDKIEEIAANLFEMKSAFAMHLFMTQNRRYNAIFFKWNTLLQCIFSWLYQCCLGFRQHCLVVKEYGLNVAA